MELALLYLLSAFSTLVHLHYGVCVVRQMCNHLGISAFTIAAQSSSSSSSRLIEASEKGNPEHELPLLEDSQSAEAE